MARKRKDYPSERDSAQTDFNAASLEDAETKKVLDDIERQTKSRRTSEITLH